MTRIDRFHSPVISLAKGDLRAAIRCLVATWFARFGNPANEVDEDLEPASFGALEPYLAVANILDGGADFLFIEWGAAMDVLCGGNRVGHRLSVLPQPCRSHLRRVCVRAAASRSPAISGATWVLDGNVWRCTLLALPIAGDDLCVRRLLVALLFMPHPIFSGDAVPEGFGWPAVALRGSVHRIRSAEAATYLRRPRYWRTAVSGLRKLLRGSIARSSVPIEQLTSNVDDNR